jgi:hypothetical protein
MDEQIKKQIIEKLEEADNLLDEENIEDEDIRCPLGELMDNVSNL